MNSMLELVIQTALEAGRAIMQVYENPETDGIVLSDYGSGTITEAVKGKLIGYAREHDIPSIVDSRYGIHRFSGIGYVKQNDAELAAAVGRKLPDAPAIYAAVEQQIHVVSQSFFNQVGICLISRFLFFALGHRQ